MLKKKENKNQYKTKKASPSGRGLINENTVKNIFDRKIMPYSVIKFDQIRKPQKAKKKTILVRVHISLT